MARPDARRRPVVALTGGPCGGKTTLIRTLRAEQPERWIAPPEAAPMLFAAGLDAASPSFQHAVVRLQTAIEDSCLEAARPGRVLLCHRGVLDALAYWLDRGWPESAFFADAGPREQLHLRYAGVIHLTTAAVGAEPSYRRWPDAHRPETVEQAAAIDALCLRAWDGHPNRVVVGNDFLGWPEKAAAAREAILLCAARCDVDA